MKVTELAQALNTSADTVRFYTRNGLLQPKKNISNGYKDYDQTQQQKLRFILSARHLGFTVEDITQIFAQANAQQSACTLVRQLIEQRLADIEQQFIQTQALRAKMQHAISEWQQMPDQQPNGQSICHLIESFSHEPQPGKGEL